MANLTMYNLTDMGLFDCHVWAQQGRNGVTGKTMQWLSPLVSVQQEAEFDRKASNRLIVQPQAPSP
jgi:hypothetical protein